MPATWRRSTSRLQVSLQIEQCVELLASLKIERLTVVRDGTPGGTCKFRGQGRRQPVILHRVVRQRHRYPVEQAMDVEFCLRSKDPAVVRFRMPVRELLIESYELIGLRL